MNFLNFLKQNEEIWKGLEGFGKNLEKSEPGESPKPSIFFIFIGFFDFYWKSNKTNDN